MTEAFEQGPEPDNTAQARNAGAEALKVVQFIPETHFSDTDLAWFDTPDFDPIHATLPETFIDGLKTYWANPRVAMVERWLPEQLAKKRNARQLLERTMNFDYDATTERLVEQDAVMQGLSGDLATLSFYGSHMSQGQKTWRAVLKGCYRLRGDELAQYGREHFEPTADLEDKEWSAIVLKLSNERPTNTNGV